MSVGKLLIAVGLSLEIAATLFISLDAVRSQRQTVKVYELLDWITGLDVIGLRAKPATEEADRRAAQAEEQLRVKGVPEGEEGLVTDQQNLESIQKTMIEAERQAALNNKEQLQAALGKIADDFASRKFLIAAAIALVLIGGVCELAGGLMEV